MALPEVVDSAAAEEDSEVRAALPWARVELPELGRHCTDTDHTHHRLPCLGQAEGREEAVARLEERPWISYSEAAAEEVAGQRGVRMGEAEEALQGLLESGSVRHQLWCCPLSSILSHALSKRLYA